MSLAFAVPPFTLWHDELWDTILDLSAMLAEDTWVLVGGQAVVAHALASNPHDQLLKVDFDELGRLVTTAAALPKLKLSFRYLGFEPEPSRNSTELRYRREAEGSAFGQRAQTWVVQVHNAAAPRRIDQAGVDQAFTRRMPYQATKGHRAPWVPIPDLLSTIIYEANTFAADPFTPFVHARAAAYLVSLIDDPREQAGRLTPDDLRSLRVFDAAVGHSNHHVWAELPSERDTFARWRDLVWGA